MGLFKVKKLQRGEKGLEQAIKINDKKDKQKRNYMLSEAVKHMHALQDAGKGFDHEERKSIDTVNKDTYFTKDSFFLKDGTFVWKTTLGTYVDLHSSKEGISTTSYLIMKTDDKGRYEITELAYGPNCNAKPTITIQTGIGTDVSQETKFRDGDEMSTEQMRSYVSAIESVQKIEDAEKAYFETKNKENATSETTTRESTTPTADRDK